MRDRTRIHAAGIVVMLIAAVCTGCSGGEETVTLQVRLVEEQPAAHLTPMTMTVWGGQETYYVHGDVLLDEGDVAAATVVRRSDGVPAIELELNDRGRLELLRVTRNHLGGHLGVIVGGTLQSVSPIHAVNGGGRLLVTGHMLEGAAKRYSEALTRGAVTASLP
jgi:hypothetical protein